MIRNHNHDAGSTLKAEIDAVETLLGAFLTTKGVTGRGQVGNAT